MAAVNISKHEGNTCLHYNAQLNDPMQNGGEAPDLAEI
jgi:hypothetical protein